MARPLVPRAVARPEIIWGGRANRRPPRPIARTAQRDPVARKKVEPLNWPRLMFPPRMPSSLRRSCPPQRTTIHRRGVSRKCGWTMRSDCSRPLNWQARRSEIPKTPRRRRTRPAQGFRGGTLPELQRFPLRPRRSSPRPAAMRHSNRSFRPVEPCPRLPWRPCSRQSMRYTGIRGKIGCPGWAAGSDSGSAPSPRL